MIGVEVDRDFRVIVFDGNGKVSGLVSITHPPADHSVIVMQAHVVSCTVVTAQRPERNKKGKNLNKEWSQKVSDGQWIPKALVSCT